jgi:hypothetical protein
MTVEALDPYTTIVECGGVKGTLRDFLTSIDVGDAQMERVKMELAEHGQARVNFPDGISVSVRTIPQG